MESHTKTDIWPSTTVQAVLTAALFLGINASFAGTIRTALNSTRQSGSCIFSYAVQPAAVRGAPAIEREFRQAHADLTRLMGCAPRVYVKVTQHLGAAFPAFYDPRSDAITVAAQWFDPDSPVPGFNFSLQQIQQLTRHVVRHELAHLFFAHRVGLARYRSQAVHLPLWLLEGFGEWAAGGAQNASRTPDEIKNLFASGLLDQATMHQAMAMNGRPKNAETNQKAYVQAFFMVNYLMGFDGGLSRFFAFERDLRLTAGQLEVCLKRHYGITAHQFGAGWTDRLRRDVMFAAQPQLSSLAGPGMGR